MLRITVELVPRGDEAQAREIARMTIANISQFADISDYQVKASEGPNPRAGTQARDIEVVVRGHDRHQRVWALIGSAAKLLAPK